MQRAEVGGGRCLSLGCMHMPVGIQLFLVNSKSTCQIRQIRQMPNAKKDCRLKLPNSKQQTTNKPITEEVGPGTWYIAGLAAGFGFAFVPVFGFRLPAGCGLPKAKSSSRCANTHTTTGDPHMPVACLYGLWLGHFARSSLRRDVAFSPPSLHKACVCVSTTDNWTSRGPVFAAGKADMPVQ